MLRGCLPISTALRFTPAAAPPGLAAAVDVFVAGGKADNCSSAEQEHLITTKAAILASSRAWHVLQHLTPWSSYSTRLKPLTGGHNQPLTICSGLDYSWHSLRLLLGWKRCSSLSAKDIPTNCHIRGLFVATRVGVYNLVK